jgi:hypothetical protein
MPRGKRCTLVSRRPWLVFGVRVLGALGLGRLGCSGCCGSRPWVAIYVVLRSVPLTLFAFICALCSHSLHYDKENRAVGACPCAAVRACVPHHPAQAPITRASKEGGHPHPPRDKGTRGGGTRTWWGAWGKSRDGGSVSDGDRQESRRRGLTRGAAAVGELIHAHRCCCCCRFVVCRIGALSAPHGGNRTPLVGTFLLRLWLALRV